MIRILRLAAVPLVLALLGALLSTTLAPQAATAAATHERPSARVPSKTTWVRDVGVAMQGGRDFLRERAATAAPGELLAINLDIDNTSLSTYYARGLAVKQVRAFAKTAHDLGYATFFNTGRLESRLGPVVNQLEKRGYTVDAMCTRLPGETLPVGKQRCRASFVAQGYTIVANVGNNPTDFVGGDYERAFVLPNYRGVLG